MVFLGSICNRRINRTSIATQCKYILGSTKKKRLKQEGADELLTNCKQLKMVSADGKKRLTDVANTRQLLRIVQSIPSRKAEPFKQWRAEVGNDRIEEIMDPEKALLRGADYYRAKGYSEGWINQRLQSPWLAQLVETLSRQLAHTMPKIKSRWTLGLQIYL